MWNLVGFRETEKERKIRSIGALINDCKLKITNDNLVDLVSISKPVSSAV